MCPECEARRKMARDALLKAKIGEASSHAVKGVAEAIGLKKKTGLKEFKQKNPGISSDNARIGHNFQE